MLFIPYRLVLNTIAFGIDNNKHSFKGNPEFERLHLTLRKIPDGTQVRQCYHEIARLGLFFRLWHPSFGIVGDFLEIPEIEWETTAAVANDPHLDDVREQLEQLQEEVSFDAMPAKASEKLKQFPDVVAGFLDK